MQASRPPAANAAARQPQLHQPAQPPPDHHAQVPRTPPGEELLSRCGDAIDDRIAEILDELLDQRNAAPPPRRLSQILGAVSLILALAASILLRHNPLAAWTIWPTAATICLTIARIRTRKL